MKIALKPIKQLGAVQVKLKSIFALKPLVEEIEEEIIEQVIESKYVFIIYTGWHWNPDYEAYYGIIKFNKGIWSVENKLHVTGYMIGEHAHCIIRNDRLYIAPVRDMSDPNQLEDRSDRGLLVINTTTNEIIKWIKFSHLFSEIEVYWYFIDDMAIDGGIAYILIDQYLCKIIVEDETISLTNIEVVGTSLAIDDSYIWISTSESKLQKRNKSDLSFIEMYEVV